ncbi:MAG: thymidylate synthase [Enterobacteriaceae bacterium]
MNQYLNLIKKIHKFGINRKDRTGIGTTSIFGHQMRFNLKDGFPLVTTKYCNISNIIYELLWFLNGETNIKSLLKNNVNIWNNWADKNGDLGPIYGKQWRKWESKNGEKIDQLSFVLKELKNNPYSRRILVSSWNVGEIKLMSLPPCHVLFQFYVADKKLNCQLYQRSCDVFLGLPYNIASYSILMHMISQQCNLEVGEFIWTGGDVHIYFNHLEYSKIQIKRTPKKLPKLKIIRKPKSLFKYKINDFKLIGYNFYPKIKAEIAV